MIKFPCELSNRQEKRIIHNEAELNELVFCDEDRSETILCLEAGIHPEYFITEFSDYFLTWYTRVRSHGFTAVFRDPPAWVWTAMDIMENIRVRRFNEQTKAARDKLKSGSGK